MRISVAFVSAGLACALAGCASPPPPAPMAAAPATAPASAPMPDSSGGLDGVYRAPPGGVHGNSACGTTAFGYPIRVVNGVASMQTVSAGRLDGKVAPDGSLVIEEGRASLRGQFNGNQFNGAYTVAGRGSSCSFTLAYTKR